MEIKKPKLTQDQKNSFEEKFNEIVSRASKEIQKLWKENGIIEWINDSVKILPEGFLQKIPKEQKDKIVTLYNDYKLPIIV